MPYLFTRSGRRSTSIPRVPVTLKAWGYRDLHFPTTMSFSTDFRDRLSKGVIHFSNADRMHGSHFPIFAGTLWAI